MDEFRNYYPGENVCPFCESEIEELDERDIAAENDNAFWIERSCETCGSRWRDYYDPDMFHEYCPSCGSYEIYVDGGEVEYDVARSCGTCEECGEEWINYYTYSFSCKFDS